MDCIVSYAATQLVDIMCNSNNDAGREMLNVVKADAKASKQVLLLAHLYAKTDAASLAFLRDELLRPRYSAKDIAAAVGAGSAVLAGRLVLGSCNLTHCMKAMSRFAASCCLPNASHTRGKVL